MEGWIRNKKRKVVWTSYRNAFNEECFKADLGLLETYGGKKFPCYVTIIPTMGYPRRITFFNTSSKDLTKEISDEISSVCEAKKYARQWIDKNTLYFYDREEEK